MIDPPKFSIYDNRIVALGPYMAGQSSRSAVVSINLTGPAAVVVGRNGSGKTRLLQSIGEGTDVILECPSLADAMLQITDLNNDPYWLHRSPDEWEDDQNGMMRQPMRLFDLATRHIEQVRQEDDALFNGNRASFAELKERLDALSDQERAAVALVWASFNFHETDNSAQTEAYLLGSAVDLVTHGQLGISRIGPKGRSRIRVWCRRDRESLPKLAELETLVGVDQDNFVADQIPLAWRSRGNLRDGFHIDGPLSYFNGDSVVCLYGAGLGRGSSGPFDVSTTTLPLWVWHLDGGIMREWEPEPLLLSALNVSPHSQQSLLNDLELASRGRRSYQPNRPDPTYEIIEDDDSFGLRSFENHWLQPPGTPEVGDSGFRGDIELFAASFVVAANRLLSHLLPVNIELFLLNDRGVLQWRAIPKHDSFKTAIINSASSFREIGLPLEALSNAERRWATFAIRFCDRFLDRVIAALGTPDEQEWAGTALQSDTAGFAPDLPAYLVLIDEPEAGLHRSAEPVLAAHLAGLARWSGVKVIVATHSPAFVREFSAIGGHVYRTHEGLDRKTVIDECEFVDLESVADAVGLDPVHMLQLVRVFLCVEGEHDKSILEELVGEDLTRHGIYVVAMRGAKGLSQVAQSNVLWSATDAEFVVVLDGIHPGEVNAILNDARKAYIEQSPDEALTILQRLDSDTVGPVTERRAIRELFYEAVQSGRLQRIHIAGLPQRDILRYLDPRHLVEFHTSEVECVRSEQIWDTLHDDWRHDTRSPRVDFKTWLASSFPGTSFNEDRLRTAVQRLDQMHPDIRALLAFIVDVADGQTPEVPQL